MVGEIFKIHLQVEKMGITFRVKIFFQTSAQVSKHSDYFRSIPIIFAQILLLSGKIFKYNISHKT